MAQHPTHGQRGDLGIGVEAAQPEQPAPTLATDAGSKVAAIACHQDQALAIVLETALGSRRRGFDSRRHRRAEPVPACRADMQGFRRLIYGRDDAGEPHPAGADSAQVPLCPGALRVAVGAYVERVTPRLPPDAAALDVAADVIEHGLRAGGILGIEVLAAGVDDGKRPFAVGSAQQSAQFGHRRHLDHRQRRRPQFGVLREHTNPVGAVHRDPGLGCVAPQRQHRHDPAPGRPLRRRPVGKGGRHPPAWQGVRHLRKRCHQGRAAPRRLHPHHRAARAGQVELGRALARPGQDDLRAAAGADHAPKRCRGASLKHKAVGGSGVGGATRKHIPGAQPFPGNQESRSGEVQPRSAGPGGILAKTGRVDGDCTGVRHHREAWVRRQ